LSDFKRSYRVLAGDHMKTYTVYIRHFVKSCTFSFYRAAWNETRSSDEKAVRLSVRLSIKRVNCDKTEER